MKEHDLTGDDLKRLTKTKPFATSGHGSHLKKLFKGDSIGSNIVFIQSSQGIQTIYKVYILENAEEVNNWESIEF